MRNFFILFFVLLFSAGGLFADSINLGDFPVGKWLDANYDAVWEFSTGNIKITSPDGKVYCDFSQKTVENFKIGLTAGKPSISFSCPETGKKYTFIKSLTNFDVTLEIERTEKALYSVVMKKQ